MENLLMSFRVVFPLFLMLSLGYGIRRANIVDDYILDGCSNLVFKVFLPVMLFLSVCGTSLEKALDVRLLIFATVGIVLFFILTMLVIPLIEKSDAKRGVMVQGIFRSNFVLFGFPVTVSLCGPENTDTVLMLIAVIVPVFNVLSVIALEIFRGGKINVGQIFTGIFKNPLIIAGVLGILVLLSGFKMPDILQKPLDDIGRTATPLALIAIGGTFKFSTLAGSAKQLIISVAGKLVVGPAIIIAAGIAFGFRGVSLAALMVLVCSPTAVSSFPMAKKMGADGALAGQIVVFTSLFSVVTIFFWIFLLAQLGLF